MKRGIFVLLSALAILCAAVFVSPSAAGGPIVKQNGSGHFNAFTSICSVPGYADYGLCGGDAGMFADVQGKLKVKAKSGRYKLEFRFRNLVPGVEYRLWATRNAVPFGGAWLEVGRAFADEDGSVSYEFQMDSPAGVGFDLNTVQGDITIVTSWWSGQQLA